ncbi:hypothetical protein LWI29_024253 [Acer saccharum]|uniref:Uncharacterized protein n=1 Tax=Acer saccharum TaxID=4024 RepID=A0AA39W6W8_ACESA|nr:hypothetical protein LWI29_024253 [Acer saccharum]
MPTEINFSNPPYLFVTPWEQLGNGLAASFVSFTRDFSRTIMIYMFLFLYWSIFSHHTISYLFFFTFDSLFVFKPAIAKVSLSFWEFFIFDKVKK